METVKKQVTLFVAAERAWSIDDNGEYQHSVSTYDLATMDHNKGRYFPLSEITIEVDVPCIDGIDFTEIEVEQLESLKKSIQAECQVKLNDIDVRIQSLLAIEHKEGE